MKLWTLYYSFVLHIKPYFQSLIDDKGFSTFPIDSNHTICLSSFFSFWDSYRGTYLFSRQNICLRTTKVEELITSFSYFSHEENLWHRFVVEWKHQFDFFFLFSSFIFHKSKTWKKVFKVVVSKYTLFLFQLRGFLCRLTSECQERPKCRVLTYDFGTLDNYRHSVVSCVNTWFTLNILKVSSTNLKCAIKRRIKRLERLKFTIVNVHQNIWTKKK